MKEYEKKGICTNCDKETIIDKSNNLCEECEEYYTYCSICGEWQYDCEECRHLTWSSHFGVMGGCGSDEGENIGKQQLTAFLDCMGMDFAKMLEPALRNDSFKFELHFSIELYVNNKGYYWDAEKPIVENAKSIEHGELAIEGMSWLLSLWAKKEDEKFYTGKYNKLTADWVKDWVKDWIEKVEAE